MRTKQTIILAAMSAMVFSATAAANETMPAGDWPSIDRDLASTRFSPLNQINRGNVSELQLAWSYQLRSVGTAVPLVIDGVMYLPAGNRILALDTDTGKEIWSYQAEGAGAVSSRGVSYWPGDERTPARILFMASPLIIALDAKTGTPISSFGDGGSVDVGVGYRGTPTIYKDIAVIGANTLENPVGDSGNTRAFNVRTGEKIWEFKSIPGPGEPGHETWQAGWEGRSGANMWAFSATVDAKNGIVYIPIGTPSPNYYGGDRPGANLFGNSIVAVDIETGEYKWHFQTIHHDIWDSDQPSSGPLIDITVDGKKRSVIAVVGKSSFFYVLDGETGEPIHPVEERWVPQGDVPTEYYHPTQPIPVVTPPLSRVAMGFDDIVTADDTSPAHAAACMKMWEDAGGYINLGPFTPFMYRAEGTPPRSTIQLPGGIGGVNWGGPASDPTTGIVYVNAIDTSLVGWTEKVTSDVSYSFEADNTDQPYNRASVDGKGPFFSFSAPISGEYNANGRAVGVSAPCYKPPWARLTAVDANTGEIKWAVPLGTFEDMPEGKQLLGNAGSAGPTVTAGGLVFVGATSDKRFRAFDSATGEQLWETVLQGNANANPMSYAGKSGRQYVAVNASGTLLVYALPKQ